MLLEIGLILIQSYLSSGTTTLSYNNASTILPSIASQDDRCNQYMLIDDWRRSYSNANTNPAESICDVTMSTTWYRFALNGTNAEIPTRCIMNNLCGTALPMHLNLEQQTLPLPGEPEIDVTACTAYNILGRVDCCVLRQRVRVHNCGRFYVYHLSAVDRCDVGFCVQKSGEEIPQSATAKTGEIIQGNTWVQESTVPASVSTTTLSLESTSELTVSTDFNTTTPTAAESTNMSVDISIGLTDTSIDLTDTSIGLTDTSLGLTDASISVDYTTPTAAESTNMSVDISIGLTDTSIDLTDTSIGLTDTPLGLTDASISVDYTTPIAANDSLGTTAPSVDDTNVTDSNVLNVTIEAVTAEYDILENLDNTTQHNQTLASSANATVSVNFTEITSEFNSTFPTINLTSFDINVTTVAPMSTGSPADNFTERGVTSSTRISQTNMTTTLIMTERVSDTGWSNSTVIEAEVITSAPDLNTTVVSNFTDVTQDKTVTIYNDTVSTAMQHHDISTLPDVDVRAINGNTTTTVMVTSKINDPITTPEFNETISSTTEKQTSETTTITSTLTAALTTEATQKRTTMNATISAIATAQGSVSIATTHESTPFSITRTTKPPSTTPTVVTPDLTLYTDPIASQVTATKQMQHTTYGVSNAARDQTSTNGVTVSETQFTATSVKTTTTITPKTVSTSVSSTTIMPQLDTFPTVKQKDRELVLIFSLRPGARLNGLSLQIRTAFAKFLNKYYKNRTRRRRQVNATFTEANVVITDGPTYQNAEDEIRVVLAAYIGNSTVQGEWISADELVSLLDEQEWRHYLEQELAFSISNYYKLGDVRVRELTDKGLDDGSFYTFFYSHLGLFVFIIVFAIVCIIVIVGGLLYLRLRTRCGTWSRRCDVTDVEKTKLSENKESTVMENPATDEEILKDEQMTEKEYVAINGNEAHVDAMDDEKGWIIPIGELTKEQKTSPNLGDTKL